jgi:hypothetical protein
MKHLIHTRCAFQDDGLFYKYFDVMKNIFIPAIKAQTSKNFYLYIDVNKQKPNHLSLINQEFDGSGVNYTLDIPNFKKTALDEKYTIQTRHDCDDYMAPNYVEHIQKLAAEKFLNFDEFLIHAQPIKHKYDTGEYYRATPKYCQKHPSMFLTLCQKQPNKTIIDITHTKFSIFVPNLFDMGYKYVRLTIHENNKLSKLNTKDALIMNHELKEYI